MSVVKFLSTAPVIRSAFRAYMNWTQRHQEKTLKQLGLLYDDILNPHLPNNEKVLEILPAEELLMREKRIKRAYDLSVKKTYLHPDAQNYDVWRPYIRSRYPLVEEIRQKEMSYKRDL